MVFIRIFGDLLSKDGLGGYTNLQKKVLGFQGYSLAFLSKVVIFETFFVLRKTSYFIYS